ncbi:MAG: MAPEG family protein [Sphingopyxis sp.]
MIRSEILHPVVALAAWTMVMWLWMYATRIPAVRQAKLDMMAKVGGTGKDLDGQLPDSVQWKAHNYNHLMAEPTIFYAVALVLAMVGAGDGLNACIAWAYVGLRVLHSLIQVLVNRVILRFAVFMLSSIALIMLVVHAYMAVIHQHI